MLIYIVNLFWVLCDCLEPNPNNSATQNGSAEHIASQGALKNTTGISQMAVRNVKYLTRWDLQFHVHS